MIRPILFATMLALVPALAVAEETSGKSNDGPAVLTDQQMDQLTAGVTSTATATSSCSGGSCTVDTFVSGDGASAFAIGCANGSCVTSRN